MTHTPGRREIMSAVNSAKAFPNAAPIAKTGFFRGRAGIKYPRQSPEPGRNPTKPGGGLSGYCPVSVLRPGPSAIAFKKWSVRSSRGFFLVPAGKTFYVLGGLHCALGDAGPLPGARRLAGLPHTERPERATFLLMRLTFRTADAALLRKSLGHERVRADYRKAYAAPGREPGPPDSRP